MLNRLILHSGVLLLLPLLAGCGASADGPELTSVSGTVTLDGQPLPDASVVFMPADGGRSAFAQTDSDGWYELGYTTTGMGTPPGEYIVSISTYREPGEDPDTGQMTPEVPETVPSPYNRPSTLRITVPADEYDFALESSAGEVIQPVVVPDED